MPSHKPAEVSRNVASDWVLPISDHLGVGVSPDSILEGLPQLCLKSRMSSS